MKLANVLQTIRGAEGEVKTAGAVDTATAKEASTADTLKTALSAALAETVMPAVKTAAAAPTPAQDLEKIANQVMTSEQDAMLKEAQAYGVAVADGFMARLAQYNDAAEVVAKETGTKTAAMVEPAYAPSADLYSQIKQASASTASTASVEKLAEAAYVKGYNEATDAIHKLASASFVEGYNRCGELL